MSLINGIIGQLDKCLDRYYAKFKIKYFSVDDEGKFMLWCANNSFDDDMVQEELNLSYNECNLLDFDEYFPFPSNSKPKNKDEAEQRIYNILQRCAKNPDMFSDKSHFSEPFKTTENDWNVNKNDLAKTAKIYRTQLITLCDKDFIADEACIKLLHMGYKQNIPYLSFLVDMYLCDRISYVCKTQNYLQPSQQILRLSTWCLKNRHFTELKNEERKNDMEAAIKSYFKRISRPLDAFEGFMIDDSLDDMADYILNIVNCISTLAKQKEQTCPFQIDISFIFKNVTQEDQRKNVPMDNSDDDDDDDNDDEKDKIEQWKFKDVIGNIKKRLNDNNIEYWSSKEQLHMPKMSGPAVSTLSHLSDNNNNNKQPGSTSRLFYQIRSFKQTTIASKYKSDYDYGIQYPRGKRVNVIIDRRNDDGSVDSDETIIYEPPIDCRNIPIGSHTPEWFFDASATCIIPNIGYNKYMKKRQQEKKEFENDNIDNIDFNKKVDIKNIKPYECPSVKCGKKYDIKPDKCLVCGLDIKNNKIITYLTSCNGGILTLSFHVESTDEIKCYLFWQGRYIRFFPKDILTILPKIFNPKINGNESFIINKDIKNLIKELKPRMRDLPFESFYNKYKLSNKQIKQIVDEIKPLSVDNNTQEFKSSVADGYNISHKNDDCKNNMEQIENVKIGCLGEFINWLQNDNSTKMYPMHFKVLESTLHDQFDEHDFEIENLLDDLDDEDNSEIMVALGQDDNCSNDYMKYIDELKKALDRYK